jgi:threonine synthase
LRYRCVKCGKNREDVEDFTCECGGIYEVKHKFPEISLDVFDKRLGNRVPPFNSGVWRYKELIHPDIAIEHIQTRPEGNTNIYRRKKVKEYSGIEDISLKHEGENPTGSFKDRGMTVAISEAKRVGAEKVACASTGNTSASMAAYAAQAELKGVVFIPSGMITFGKLSQALAYGAKVIQVKGNFDDAMHMIKKWSKELGLYVLNSLNPWRIEGQKSIIFELLQQRNWDPPDWISVPAGNLGNTSAFGKALRELSEMGLIDNIPRLASIQAEGANPFYNYWKNENETLEPMKPDTIASAIKIGNPVSWRKAIDSIRFTKGLVEQVSDAQIMNAKAVIDSSGVGCEPASAASLAGVKKLRRSGVISQNDSVVCVLTGNLLKDPENTVNYHMNKIDLEAKYTNKPIEVDPEFEQVKKAIERE